MHRETWCVARVRDRSPDGKDVREAGKFGARARESYFQGMRPGMRGCQEFGAGVQSGGEAVGMRGLSVRHGTGGAC